MLIIFIWLLINGLLACKVKHFSKDLSNILRSKAGCLTAMAPLDGYNSFWQMITRQCLERGIELQRPFDGLFPVFSELNHLAQQCGRKVCVSAVKTLGFNVALGSIIYNYLHDFGKMTTLSYLGWCTWSVLGFLTYLVIMRRVCEPKFVFGMPYQNFTSLMRFYFLLKDQLPNYLVEQNILSRIELDRVMGRPYGDFRQSLVKSLLTEELQRLRNNDRKLTTQLVCFELGYAIPLLYQTAQIALEVSHSF